MQALRSDLDALRAELRQSVSEEDVAHLRRVERTGWALSALGWATSWIAPNPLSVVALSTGIFARWTMVAHHVVHQGYDRAPGVPQRLTSAGFARGWRRWVDWPDWIDPEAWRFEHNQLHHYRLGETADPDQPEMNLEILRDSPLPRWLRVLAVCVAMCVWKPLYYAPNTVRALQNHDADEADRVGFLSPRMWWPFTRPGRTTWWRCYLPYVALHFVLLPLPFLAISTWAWAFALTNRLLAEVLTNVHSWLIIVPNHAGEDVHRFDEPMRGRAEFYLRQIVGTVNYKTGGFWNDFLHGWLNYQIEHHLFPDLTLRQYALAQPRVEAICEKHGVPYLQESIGQRVRAVVRVLVGDDTMPRWPLREEPVRAAAE